MKDIEKIDRLSTSKRIKDIIRRVSNDNFYKLSYMEKSTVYKELNDILNEKFSHKIKLLINKHSDEYDSILEINHDSLIINGLDYNPYTYIQNIILNHVMYNQEDTDFISFGDIYYSTNYKSTDYDIYKYSAKNLEILLSVNSLMRDLLSDYCNNYKDEYNLLLDSNISKEARVQLLAANEVLDSYYKKGTYDALNNISEILKKMCRQKRLSKSELALLSLDEVLREYIYTINGIENKESIDLISHLNQFVEVFYPEYAKWIKFDFTNKNIIINNRVVNENNLFIDILMQEIEKIEKNEDIANSLINDEQLNVFNDGKYNYNKLDLYLYYKLDNIDRYLKHNNDLKVINYPEWKKVFYDNEEETIFGDIKAVSELLKNDKFISLVEKYLYSPSKTHKELYQIIDMLNKITGCDSILTINDNHIREAKYGESNKQEIYLYTENCEVGIKTFITLLHEYRHNMQHSKSLVEQMYNKVGTRYIKMNIMDDDMMRMYARYDVDSGYYNNWHYICQPAEYDAEKFTENFFRAIVSKLSKELYIDYPSLFPDNIADSKYIDIDKYCIKLYKNYLNINNVSYLINEDKNNINTIITQIEKMKSYEDAVEIVKLPYFSLISTDMQIEVYKLLAQQQMTVNYIKGEGKLCLNDKVLDVDELNYYEIIEAILLTKATTMVKNRQLKFTDINKYVYDEAKQFKIEEINCFNVYSVYNYYRCFDKYLWLINKNKTKGKCIRK